MRDLRLTSVFGRRTFRDLRPTYDWQVSDHFVGKLFSMGQPTRPTITPGSVNE